MASWAMADADVRLQEKGTTLFSSSWTTCLALSSCHYPCDWDATFWIGGEDMWRPLGRHQAVIDWRTEEWGTQLLIWPGLAAWPIAGCCRLPGLRSQARDEVAWKRRLKLRRRKVLRFWMRPDISSTFQTRCSWIYDIIDIYDAAKLRLKAPRKEKNIKKTRCRRCAQVLQVSFHDSKTYCTHNSYIKGYLHYMVISDLGSLSHQLLFFFAASMPQSFLVLDSRRIIPETHTDHWWLLDLFRVWGYLISRGWDYSTSWFPFSITTFHVNWLPRHVGHQRRWRNGFGCNVPNNSKKNDAKGGLDKSSYPHLPTGCLA